MDYPEPESELDPSCSVQIDPLSYFIMFFGAGAGWFAMGYLLSDCVWNRGTSNLDPNPILAESIN